MRYMWIALIVLSWPLATLAAAEENPRTISTQGEAVVYVVPDQVIINFGVQSTDARLDIARATNDRLAAGLVRAIKAMDINDRQIQTDAMNVSIRYVSGQRMAIEGYEATRNYVITLKDVSKFEQLIDTGLKNGANIFSGFTYTTTELRKHRDNARAMAIKAAQEKAIDLARGLNCTVGAPRTITESSGSSVYLGGSSLSRGANVFAQNSMQVVGGNDTGPEGETMPLGQIAVRANVSVTFDLVPPK
jgi:uncharacterized protein